MVAAATARTRRAATVATRRTRPVVMAMAVVVATRNRRATTRAAGIRQAGIRRVGMAAIETVGIRPDMGALPTPAPTRAADTVDPTAVATRMVAAAATDMVPRLSNRLDVAIESESVTCCFLANWPSRTANPSCASLMHKQCLLTLFFGTALYSMHF
ncbi:hypothetical protein BCR44DRAFT_1440546 [Catenaria anguillulae PL171]|uniref:Uncharacterized protein n=1 Tax=Catenaria anguillulae PL171 TaxID=765915 RepID=A0A1Y2HEJ5_9FUNG|nr:hypothetical protein BCR44DRAFT_1440546 [Catenaria anguillulae PL171]